MIYLTTNKDGNNTEGIGAMVQYQLFCYSLAKKLNLGYYFTGFERLTHWQYYNITQEEFINDINEFFNLPSEKNIDIQAYETIPFFEFLKRGSLEGNFIVDVDPATLMKWGQKEINLIEESNWLKEFGANLTLKPELIDQTINQEDYNIAIHIRKYTKTDCDDSAIRDLYDQTKIQYYKNLIKSLIKHYPRNNLKIQIYGQGTKEEYTDLLSGDYVRLHIEQYPLTSLYHMIKSDIFVMANSSFSYIVSLLRSDKTFKKENFYHAVYPTIKTLNFKGEIVL
jgi:hypothetical protein